MTTGGPANQLPLRDIHLPEPLSNWWPLAPGWWLLAGGLAILVGSCWLLLRWRRQRRWRRVALAELESVQAFYMSSNNRPQMLRQLSTLLRRVALKRFPRSDCAALTGDDWLRFLDATTDGDQFLTGPGRILADGPYQRPTPEDDMDRALLELCRKWLKGLPGGRVR